MTHRTWTIFQPPRGTRYHCDCCSCMPPDTYDTFDAGDKNGNCRFGCEDISDESVFVLMLANRWVWEFPGEDYL